MERGQAYFLNHMATQRQLWDDALATAEAEGRVDREFYRKLIADQQDYVLALQKALDSGNAAELISVINAKRGIGTAITNNENSVTQRIRALDSIGYETTAAGKAAQQNVDNIEMYTKLANKLTKPLLNVLPGLQFTLPDYASKTKRSDNTPEGVGNFAGAFRNLIDVNDFVDKDKIQLSDKEKVIVTKMIVENLNDSIDRNSGSQTDAYLIPEVKDNMLIALSTKIGVDDDEVRKQKVRGSLELAKSLVPAAQRKNIGTDEFVKTDYTGDLEDLDRLGDEIKKANTPEGRAAAQSRLDAERAKLEEMREKVDKPGMSPEDIKRRAEELKAPTDDFFAKRMRRKNEERRLNAIQGMSDIDQKTLDASGRASEILDNHWSKHPTSKLPVPDEDSNPALVGGYKLFQMMNDGSMKKSPLTIYQIAATEAGDDEKLAEQMVANAYAYHKEQWTLRQSPLARRQIKDAVKKEKKEAKVTQRLMEKGLPSTPFIDKKDRIIGRVDVERPYEEMGEGKLYKRQAPGYSEIIDEEETKQVRQAMDEPVVTPDLTQTLKQHPDASARARHLFESLIDDEDRFNKLSPEQKNVIIEQYLKQALLNEPDSASWSPSAPKQPTPNTRTPEEIIRDRWFIRNQR